MAVSDDEWLNSNSYTGAGNTKPADVVAVMKDNLLLSAVCDMSNYPNSVKDFTVAYNYEAWFTGKIDSASLALHIQHVNSKLVGYLAKAATLCTDASCTSGSNNCINQLSNSMVNKVIMGVSKNGVDSIQTNCKSIGFGVFYYY